MTTERLGLGQWSSSDLPLALSLWGNAEVTALIGGPFTADQVTGRLAAEIEAMKTYNVQYWPVFLLETGAHAGCAGLRPRPLDQLAYELGFHFLPEYWGRGLAQEAGRAVIAFAFEQIGAQSLFAGHHPANAASARVLAKLGFRYTHDEFYSPTGFEHASYRLTRADYLRI